MQPQAGNSRGLSSRGSSKEISAGAISRVGRRYRENLFLLASRESLAVRFYTEPRGDRFTLHMLEEAGPNSEA